MKKPGTRSETGLIVSLRVIDDKMARLIFVDAKPDRTKPRTWKSQTLFTWHEYDSKRFSEMNLAKREYAEIGETIILRLLALNGKL